jgi:hypothetical protein
MRQLWSFIGLKKNRDILAWIGGGLTVVIVGLWTAVVYFSDTSKMPGPPGDKNCGSVVARGWLFGNTNTISNINCSEQKPGPKP